MICDNDVYLLVRIVQENRHGQVASRLLKGERAAADRLISAGMLSRDPTARSFPGFYCPTPKGFALVQQAFPKMIECAGVN